MVGREQSEVLVVCVEVLVEREQSEVDAEVETVTVNANVEAAVQGKDLNVSHHLFNDVVENSATVGNELATCLASRRGFGRGCSARISRDYCRRGFGSSKVVCCNMKGVRKEKALGRIKYMINRVQPDFLCVIEPLANASAVMLASSGIHQFEDKFFHNNSDSRRYDIWCVSTRRELWDMMEAMASDQPWLVIGDFNIVLRIDEKRGGQSPNLGAMKEFAETINTCMLKYVRYGVGNTQGSDHGSLVGKGVTWIPKPKNTPFKFNKMWVNHCDFKGLVAGNWRLDMAGVPLHRLTGKLKRLKVTLKKWNQDIFGQVDANIRMAQLALDLIQEKADETPEDDSLVQKMIQRDEALNKAMVDRESLFSTKEYNKMGQRG
ncbi:hypothetical protein FRX31_009453 [Thalictrum thalictroides]|uniref:Exo_endo_phos domain-containing protein n=1 Tax=Thalictrum thalictroides TaxID=46969 RepID=A0A7J6WU57_THATH|nr:hypothetical protein FRX31_009453 [Thalictrum thalictroides]